jgi:alkane 1-monooxygenase
LPSGYPGCFCSPPFRRLWFKVMDPKVVAWAGGDLSKTNLDPRRARRDDQSANSWTS